jgi:hypothetical protein
MCCQRLLMRNALMRSRAGSGTRPAPCLGQMCLRGEIGDAGGESAQGFRAQPIVGVPALRLGCDEACFAEDAQVMADRGLSCSGFFHQMAGAHLLASKQAHDLCAERVTKKFHGGLGDVWLRVRDAAGNAFINFGNSRYQHLTMRRSGTADVKESPGAIQVL